MSSRREFLAQVGGATALGLLVSACSGSKAAISSGSPFFYEMSLAEWSLHKALFANKITNLEFPGIAKKQYGISVVEYVNQFFKDKANDTKYLNDLLTRCKDNGVTNHLIMCDGEGSLGDLEAARRKQAEENHYKCVDAAKYLGCRTIRVNAFGEGSAEEVQKAAMDGVGKLGDYGA